MDLVSAYGWLAFGVFLSIWFVIVAAKLVGHRWRPGLAIFMTVVLVIFAGTLVANDRWGTRLQHQRYCQEWRARYVAAATMVELQKAKDGLNDRRCPLFSG